MAKRSTRNPAARVRRFEKEGRGLGVGSNYKPWMNIQDVRSNGLVSRVKGWKTQRIHHFLSNLELSYFFVLEWMSEVDDIREHYPLDLTETLSIAASCNLRHPLFPGTREPQVLTTDFFVTIRSHSTVHSEARAVIPSKNLTKPRTRDRLEIEQRFWRSHGVEWQVVTEADIPKQVARNVSLLHGYLVIDDRVQLSSEQRHAVSLHLTSMVKESSYSLSRVTTACDRKFGLKPGSSLAVAFHLLATRRWSIDMHVELNPASRLILNSYDRSLNG